MCSSTIKTSFKKVSRRYKRDTTLRKKAVVLNGDRDRISNTSTIPADRIDANLDKRVTDCLEEKFITEFHLAFLHP